MYTKARATERPVVHVIKARCCIDRYEKRFAVMEVSWENLMGLPIVVFVKEKLEVVDQVLKGGDGVSETRGGELCEAKSAKKMKEEFVAMEKFGAQEQMENLTGAW